MDHFKICALRVVVCWTVAIHIMAGIPVATMSGSRERNRESDSTPAGYTQQAIERLSQVFGIDQVPSLIHHGSPPEYMMQLYNSVAFSDGISKRANPYDADVVRGFPDRATNHQTHYVFNVSYVAKTEDVLRAELHLFKMRPRLDPEDSSSRHHKNLHVVELRLYQALGEDWQLVTSGVRQVDQRRISIHSSGWQVFDVTATIRRWVNNSDTNYGFVITATLLDGTPVNGTYVRFAQRNEHHDSKQPILVVFSGDMLPQYFMSRGQTTSAPQSEAGDLVFSDEPLQEHEQNIASVRKNYINFLNEGYRAEHGGAFPYKKYRLFMSEYEHQQLLADAQYNKLLEERSSSRARTRRSNRKRQTSSTRTHPDYYRYPRRKHKACQRNELYVDFDEIGWSGWIISPKGYNAHHCYGECQFPLGQYHRPTNHATVQSIVYTMKIQRGVELPCCVPDKLFSISLLYFDDEENVILKQYDEMVAASCGCH